MRPSILRETPAQRAPPRSPPTRISRLCRSGFQPDFFFAATDDHRFSVRLPRKGRRRDLCRRGAPDCVGPVESAIPQSPVCEVRRTDTSTEAGGKGITLPSDPEEVRRHFGTRRHRHRHRGRESVSVSASEEIYPASDSRQRFPPAIPDSDSRQRCPTPMPDPDARPRCPTPMPDPDARSRSRSRFPIPTPDPDSRPRCRCRFRFRARGRREERGSRAVGPRTRGFQKLRGYLKAGSGLKV
jgi:hypothetical protein